MHSVRGSVAAEFPDYSVEQMFALAADIESYPAFIPACRRARILSRDGNVWLVDNHFGAGPVDAGFHTRAELAPPGLLVITTDQAPFRQLRLEWRFEPLPGGGCRVVAAYDLALRSPLLNGLAAMAMPEASRKIIRRFQQRAAALYA